MAGSSSISSSSDSLTEQELELLKRLSKKYEQKESKQKKSIEESKKEKEETEKSKKQVASSRTKDWKFFGKDEFNFKELFEFQGWMDFLSLNRPCYENVVKEFYGCLKTSRSESFSVKIEGKIKALSYADLSKIFNIPNIGSKVEMCIMWNITKKKPFNLYHTIFDKMQNSPKKLTYGMMLTHVFEFSEVKLNESEGHNVSKLDSGSLKLKDEEGDEEKEKGIEEEKKKKEKEEKLKEEEKEETEKEKEIVAEVETELESEIEKEKEKVEVKTEEKKDSEKFEKEKTVEIEEASDAETEKLELIEEEKETEAKAEKESELLSAQRSREAMLGRMEKELIEEHNKELDEVIKQSKAMIEDNQSVIASLERMKNINERRLATLKVK
ncbi:hypothetical protein JCGZ_13696 [Jatropha curcas]|uniref:Uncharacterized protein n=1 Tax=Jatropha curcas TaxID=180498 RepID=A0A067KKW2_JATCU|nr:hypothetical protein JCGZ_13696 [Jatropha curcas]